MKYVSDRLKKSFKKIKQVYLFMHLTWMKRLFLSKVNHVVRNHTVFPCSLQSAILSISVGGRVLHLVPYLIVHTEMRFLNCSSNIYNRVLLPILMQLCSLCGCVAKLVQVWFHNLASLQKCKVGQIIS